MGEKIIDPIECFALSIARWVIDDLLLEVLINKDFFTTQIFISNVEVNSLSLVRNNLKGNFKAFKIKVHFTTLYEPQFDKGGNVISIPSVEGEILFEKINKEDFAYWQPYWVDLGIENYLGVSGFKHFSYLKTSKISNGEMFKSSLKKKKDFENFTEKFSRHVFPLGISIFQET